MYESLYSIFDINKIEMEFDMIINGSLIKSE